MIPVAYTASLVSLLSKLNSIPACFLRTHAPGFSNSPGSQMQQGPPIQAAQRGLSESPSGEMILPRIAYLLSPFLEA